jgi:hypothetical protein
MNVTYLHPEMPRLSKCVIHKAWRPIAVGRGENKVYQLECFRRNFYFKIIRLCSFTFVCIFKIKTLKFNEKVQIFPS